MNHIDSWLFGALSALAMLLPATLAGLVTEYVGTLNIALEGLILLGAFTYVAAGAHFGAVAGVVLAVLLASATAWAADAFARRTRADTFVVGLAVNMMVPAVTSMASLYVLGTKGVVAVRAVQSPVVLASLADVPFSGWMAAHRLSDYLALLAALTMAVVLGRTPFGLRARALGMNIDAVRMAGLDACRVRSVAYAMSGLAAGIAGVALAASIGAWVPGMSAGRGWIALVAVYLGGKTLVGSMLASVLFAMLLSLATTAQGFSGIPPEVLMALPYFAAVMVVVASAAGRRSAQK